ncbi:MAG: hypothetical protein J3Q66DRAFT_342981 [Benniella sp.]|nr:MAG: hypothetical protein J3Q66DRAFT_342981 [Benniella sp.]
MEGTMERVHTFFPLSPNLYVERWREWEEWSGEWGGDGRWRIVVVVVVVVVVVMMMLAEAREIAPFPFSFHCVVVCVCCVVCVCVEQIVQLVRVYLVRSHCCSHTSLPTD